MPSGDQLTTPQPTDSVESIVYWLGSVDANTAKVWMDRNARSLDTNTLDTIRAELTSLASSQSTTGDDTSSALGVVEVVDEWMASREAAENKANENSAAEEEVDKLAAKYEAAGMDPETAREQATDDLGLNLGTPTPMLIKQMTGGKALTNSQRLDMVEAWNEFKPFDPVSNWADLVAKIDATEQDGLTQRIVNYGLTDVSPVQTYEYTIRSTNPRFGSYVDRKVRVGSLEFEAMQNLYGGEFSHNDLARFVNIAGAGDVRSPAGDVAWQIPATIAAALGFYDMDRPEEGWNVGEDRDSRAARKKRNEKTRSMTAREQAALENKMVQYNKGFAMYNNMSMAWLHAINPSLASKLSRVKTVEELDPHDLVRVQGYFRKGGWDPKDLDAMGLPILGVDPDLLGLDMSGGGSGPSGSIRVLPDPEALRQKAKDLYISLFAADPTESQLQSLVAAVNGAITGAADNQDIDPGAQLRKAVEGMDEYKTLYKNKPGGMTEDEYKGQFVYAAQSILGASAVSPTMIQSGMRTGKYQTTVGQAAGSEQAKESSTWQGRLARAAQVVSENT